MSKNSVPSWALSISSAVASSGSCLSGMAINSTQCFADNNEVAKKLVEQGYAYDWTKFSGGHYSKDRNGKACS